jgi:hypothetical protein
MSHPLVVEAIENEFIPVLIYNNRKGRDAQLLARFKEPSWNNPVVRYFDSKTNDIIPRKDGVWSTAGTVERMKLALKAAKRPVPKYLANLTGGTADQETATFAMHCYWEGEGLLGSIDGVNGTRSAWRDGLEVVSLRYDPAIVDYADLVTAAQSMECASKIFTHSKDQLKIAKSKVGTRAVAASSNQSARVAKASDQKYYLRHTPMIHLPLTEFQATKINGALKNKRPYKNLLSAGQIELAERIISIKQSDKAAFQKFTYPTDEAKLADYWRELESHLEKLEK